MASSTIAASSLLSARSPVAARRSSSSRPALRVFAAQDKQAQTPAPRDAVLKTFGAIAAAQLAFSGAALADILPKSAQSSSARDEINQKTSDLPSFGDVGNALKKNFGQTDPKDVGRAIDNATPDAPDLTKNPREIGKDIKRTAERVVGDVSDLPSPKQLGNQVKNQAKNLGNDIGANLPNGNVADKAGSKVKNVANSADSKVKNAVNELSELPNPKQLGNQVKNQAKNLGNDIGANLPGGGNVADKAASKAKNVANSADRKVKNAVNELSDLPELPNPFKGSADPENVAKDVKNKAQGIGNDISKNLPNSGDLPDLGDAKRAAGDAKRAVDNNTPNLPNLGDIKIPKNS